MTRREFLGASAAAAGTLLLGPACAAASGRRSQPRIPRWRGFNLTAMAGGRAGRDFTETDFQWMAELGFDFARLPLSYWAWSSPKDWMTINPDALKPIDRAVELGRQHGIPISLGFHRIPGYCVNGREREPY